MPETLNDLGSNVIVLVLGMYSCPYAADRNCLRPSIDEISIQSVARLIGGCQTVQALVHQSGDLEDYLCRRGNQSRSRNTGEMGSYFLALVMNLAAAFCTLCKRCMRSSLTPYNKLLQ